MYLTKRNYGRKLLSSALAADAWNDGLDSSIYVRGTELARRVGVDGYYVRIAPPESQPGFSMKNAPVGYACVSSIGSAVT